jgi:hypothetical protein
MHTGQLRSRPLDRPGACRGRARRRPAGIATCEGQLDERSNADQQRERPDAPFRPHDAPPPTRRAEARAIRLRCDQSQRGGAGGTSAKTPIGAAQSSAVKTHAYVISPVETWWTASVVLQMQSNQIGLITGQPRSTTC